MARVTRWIAFWLILAAPTSSAGQGIARSFDQLQVLVRPGDSITVRDASGGEIAGTVQRLSTSSLMVVSSGTQREFREADVSTISQRRQDSLVNGAWIGFFSGIAAGGIVAAVFCEDCDATAIWGVAIYGGIGAGAGVGVDALIKHRQVIFQKETGAVSLGVEPLLGRARRGLSLSIGF